MSEFSPFWRFAGGLAAITLPVAIVGMLLALDNVYKGTTYSYAYALGATAPLLVLGPFAALILFRRILRARASAAWNGLSVLGLFIATLFLVAGSVLAYVTERSVFQIVGTTASDARGAK